MKKETKITFEFENKEKTSVLVKRDGEKIGRIWSHQDDYSCTTPYPHDKTDYCLNSVQICGFDRMSEIWACGPFSGKKDCVIHFIPTKHEYYQERIKRYEEYVKGFFKGETKVLKTGCSEFTISRVEKREGKQVEKLLSFDEWVRTIGAI